MNQQPLQELHDPTFEDLLNPTIGQIVSEIYTEHCFLIDSMRRQLFIELAERVQNQQDISLDTIRQTYFIALRYSFDNTYIRNVIVDAYQHIFSDYAADFEQLFTFMRLPSFNLSSQILAIKDSLMLACSEILEYTNQNQVHEALIQETIELYQKKIRSTRQLYDIYYFEQIAHLKKMNGIMIELPQSPLSRF